MKRLRRWFNAVLDVFGFYVPAEVSADMPKNLDEYRRRKATKEAALRNAMERGL